MSAPLLEFNSSWSRWLEALNTKKTGNNSTLHPRTQRQVDNKRPSPAEHMIEICQDSLRILPTASRSINLWQTPEQLKLKHWRRGDLPLETFAENQLSINYVKLYINNVFNSICLHLYWSLIMLMAMIGSFEYEETGKNSTLHPRTQRQVANKRPSLAEHIKEICQDSLRILPTASRSINLWKLQCSWSRCPDEDGI